MLLDPETFSYGLIMHKQWDDPKSDAWLIAEKPDGGIIVIPLLTETADPYYIHTFWNEYGK